MYKSGDEVTKRGIAHSVGRLDFEFVSTQSSQSSGFSAC